MFTVAAGPEEPKQPRSGGSLPIPKSRRGVKGFFAEVGRDMKKVSWPTRPETTRLTGVVLAVCAILVTVLTVLGYVSDLIIRLVTRGAV
jgi:preprotein translocase subunit SecE